MQVQSRMGLHFMVFCLLLTGCAELRITTLTPIVEPPEVIGRKGRVALDGGIQQEGLWKVTDDASGRPPTLTGQHGKLQTGYFLGGGIGLAERLDVGLRITGVADAAARVKFQVLGDGLSQAKESGISLALFSSYSYNRDSSDGDQKGEFGPGGYPWKAEGEISSWQGGASLGYRFSPQMMAFLGYAYGDYNGKYKIEQTAANGDPGGSYTGNMSGRGQTASLGFVAGAETRINITASYHDLRWSHELGSIGTSLAANILVPIGK